MPTTALKLVDAHLHLQDGPLPTDLAGVLARAAGEGVAHFICNGTCEADWAVVADLANAHPQIAPCFGLHPWRVKGRSAGWLSVLEERIAGTTSGVGEIGLDRWLEDRDEPAQEEVFRAQLALARKHGRPAMVHCLRAWGWLMEVLGNTPVVPPMLIHAYGGAVELIAPLAGRGAYFSFAGNAFEARRTRARLAMAAVPLDRLLIETDSPAMLPPAGLRRYAVTGNDGEEYNEPANLRQVLAGMAQVRGMDEVELAGILLDNARRLFGPLIG